MLRGLIKHLRDTQCFVKYKEKVTEYNADALGLFLSFGVITIICFVLMELLVLRTANFWFAFVLLAYFLICLFFYKRHIFTKVDYSTLYLYLAQIPVVILAVLMGTVFDKTSAAFSVLAVLIALPPFILDKPWRVLLYILSISVFFIIMASSCKTGDLLRHDIVHLIIFTLISIATTFFVLDNRIEIVEKSQVFLKDSEHDPLTGLFNRRGGEEKIREFVDEKIGGLFLLLDIDDFKHVNDTYGHAMGDEILSAVSMALAASFRSTDIVMRMGGDEFIVYAPGLLNYFFIDGKLQQLNARMREITCQQGRDNITVSIGAVINDGSYPNYEAIFNEADALLYEMKSSGKNGFRLQDRPYEEIASRNQISEAARIRAMREKASEEEEKKYKK